jgi:hypothetical protein
VRSRELRLLEALNEYVATQIEPLGDGVDRTVRVRDEAGAEPHTVTVAKVLLQEVEHAREHVAAAPPLRRARPEWVRSTARARLSRITKPPIFAEGPP